MSGPIQGSFPGTWNYPQLTGNSDCTIIKGILWLVSTSAVSSSPPGPDFSWFYSDDYGITFTQGGSYSFPNKNSTPFDPAVCQDSNGYIHIIGTRTGYAGSPPVKSGTFDVVKFTLDSSPRWIANHSYALNAKVTDFNGSIQIVTTPGTSGITEPTWSTSGTTTEGSVTWTFVAAALQGPFALTTGEEIQGDYDIVPLVNGNTYAVLDIITPDSADALKGYEITPSGVVVYSVIILSSASRVGDTFGALSLVSTNGDNLELYFTEHPKSFQFTDMTVQVNVIKKTTGVWGSPTTLRNIICRQSSTKFSVIANGNSRYLAFAYYTQSRSGLIGNSLVGYLASILAGSWTFNDFLGTITQSIVEPTLTVMTGGSPPVSSVTLTYLIRDMTLSGVTDSIVIVADLNVTDFQLTVRQDFRNPPRLSFLRGTRDVVPSTSGWLIFGENSSYKVQFLSGYNVTPIAIVTPLTLTAYRGIPYTFDASGSSDANADPLQYEWSISSLTGVSLIPNYPPLSTNSSATLVVSNSVGPAGFSITLTAGAVDIDFNNNPIHFPPTGMAIATAVITVPAVPIPIITWPSNPVSAARNSTVTLTPTVTVDSHTFPTYSFVQTSGTIVSTGGSSSTLTFSTSGANINGETLTFSLTVNDGINTPVSSTVSVDVVAYTFITFDDHVLARSNFISTSNNLTPTNIAYRNTTQMWSSPIKSSLYTNMTSIRRSVTLQGHDRFISISPSSVLVNQYNPEINTAILRRLLPPSTNIVPILDAVHTEQDQTFVLLNNQKLYRYSTAPLISTDNPDATLNLPDLTSFTVNRIFITATIANKRILILSGPNGLVLLQVKNDTLEVQGKLEISKESGLIYGADNVQFVRQTNLESLHTGKLLIGTLGSDGATYETLIDMAHGLIIGTWDKTKLRNQIVTSGEILFEPFSGYVGLQTAPVLNPVVTDNNYVATLSWTQERPDLVQSYVISVSIDLGPYNTLATITSGVALSYTTGILDVTKNYRFKMYSVSADGTSPDSNIQTLIPITSTPSPVLTIPYAVTDYVAPIILQSAQANFQGISSDSISLPNLVKANSLLLFVNSNPNFTPGLTDNNRAVYSNAFGIFNYTTNLVAGSLKISYSGTSYTSGTVFLYEIANADPLKNSFSSTGSGGSFSGNYSTSTPNSLEIISTQTAGVLIANSFGIGLSSILANAGFFSLGDIVSEFVGQYTPSFTQAGSGSWSIRGSEIPSRIVGSAQLTWTQQNKENVVGYRVQQQILGSPPGSYTTLTTLNSPDITSYNVTLNPQMLNSGTMSTQFNFRVVAMLKANVGDTAPSEVISVKFPLQASVGVSSVHAMLSTFNLVTNGSIIGGNAPFTFSILGTAPTGVTLSSAGVLSINSPTVGVLTPIIQITDSLGVTIYVVSQITVS
jgi:hypothetical protein